MYLSSALALGLVSTGFGHVIQNREPVDGFPSAKDLCGTQATEDWIAADFALPDPTQKRQAANLTEIVVDAYFHVVTNSTRVEDGNVPDSTLEKQFEALNADYAPHGISFRLKEITRTVNSRWATSGNQSDLNEMRTQLRRGDYKTVNVYYMTMVQYPAPGDILNGLCTLPTTVTSPNSTAFLRDGCLVWHVTLPGSPREAKTTTHEIGHWFGLLHTFQGGCSGTGDGVDDTPAEKTASRSCDVKRDTCPDQEGFDPVNNFMDYSPPPCRNQFTKGQGTRMHNEFFTYRLSSRANGVLSVSQ